MPRHFEFLPPEGDFAAVLFDCDGTLVDSMPLHWESWDYALRAAGAPYSFSAEAYRELAGVDTLRTVEILNQRHGAAVDPAAVAHHKRDHFLARQHAVRPIAAVSDWAHALHRRGVPLAVVSGGLRAVVERSLDFTGLRPIFREIVTFEDVENGKPAPDMFLLAAARLAASPADCLVVEDGEPGVRGALAAGMQVAWVHEREGEAAYR
jgi:HAD superfamily hydrolase (TIGR01509 family)